MKAVCPLSENGTDTHNFPCGFRGLYTLIWFGFPWKADPEVKDLGTSYSSGRQSQGTWWGLRQERKESWWKVCLSVVPPWTTEARWLWGLPKTTCRAHLKCPTVGWRARCLFTNSHLLLAGGCSGNSQAIPACSDLEQVCSCSHTKPSATRKAGWFMELLTEAEGNLCVGREIEWGSGDMNTICCGSLKANPHTQVKSLWNRLTNILPAIAAYCSVFAVDHLLVLSGLILRADI